MSDTQNIKGTRTEKNLANAYVAESCAYTRYTFYGQQASKEGYFQYANIFAETADNELHHAKIFLKFLPEGTFTPAPVGVDNGQIAAGTLENLKIAAHEEQVEGVELYTEAARVAEEEGFADIAARFRAIATIEAHHEARFRKMAERIETDTVWRSEKPVKWQCLVCGYIFEGTEPPKVCPACLHPYNHAQREADNI